MKRSPAEQKAWEAQLTELTLDQFFQDVRLEFTSKHRTRLVAQLRRVYNDADERGKGVLDQVGRGNGKRISNFLRSVLGLAGLRAWANERHPELARHLGGAALDQAITSFLSRHQDTSTQVLVAAIRHHVKRENGPDDALINETLGKHLQQIKEATMATATVAVVPDYHVDVKAVPPSAIPATSSTDTYDADYTTSVAARIKGQIGVDKTGNEHVYAAIMGSLLLDGYYDWTAQGFNDNIASAWLQIQKAVTDASGQPILVGSAGSQTPLTGSALYADIQDAVQQIRGTADSSGKPLPGYTFFQEFAQAGRQLIGNGKAALVNQPPAYFVTAVRVALDTYVSGAPAGGSLQLPPLSDTDGGDSEIVADNVLAVSMVYAAYQLEQVKLIPVIERTVEVWSNGQLALAFGPAGKALDRWYWDSFERMSDAARMMQFTRVLGAKGGEVSKEVLPNTNFNDLLLRFLSSLSEYDRQTRIADIVGNNRAGSVSDAQVRKAGRDLAANMSLYGWGGTQFAARRLNQDIASAVAILQMPEIQNAWGVQSAWQVVERVCSQEFSFTPNVVKYRTMAESGKAILDLVGKYYNVWGSTTDNPLFCNKFDPYSGNCAGSWDISPEDQRKFMRHTEYWLAVNGIKDQQVEQNAEPSDTAFSPSIPSLEPAATNGSSGALADQLRQMVQQGQTPTLDQIQKMLPVAKVGV
jgi:hypothetical protein